MPLRKSPEETSYKEMFLWNFLAKLLLMIYSQISFRSFRHKVKKTLCIRNSLSGLGSGDGMRLRPPFMICLIKLAESVQLGVFDLDCRRKKEY